MDEATTTAVVGHIPLSFPSIDIDGLACANGAEDVAIGRGPHIAGWSEHESNSRRWCFSWCPAAQVGAHFAEHTLGRRRLGAIGLAFREGYPVTPRAVRLGAQPATRAALIHVISSILPVSVIIA